jgi:GNAT superfamily N-acetyltransferase
MSERPFERRRGSLTITTDPYRLDVDAALGLLRTTFWGPAMERELLARAMANSLCFGMFDGDRLIGFARIVTDRATYAYWTDVVTTPEYRSRGLGEWLGRCMLAHPDLQGLRRVGLLTRDAARLYARLGFTTDLGGLTYMERRSPSEPTE